MEYCGAGSVSDIIRLRNKTVSLPSGIVQRQLVSHTVFSLLCIHVHSPANVSGQMAVASPPFRASFPSLLFDVY